MKPAKQKHIKIRIDDSLYEMSASDSFPTFIDKLQEMFAGKIPKCFKLQYKDADGDLITVTTQDDYSIALEDSSNPSFCFIVTKLEEDLSEPKPVVPSPIGFADAESTYFSQNPAEACFSCNGSKANKKGQPCKKCNGTGKMNPAIRSLKKHLEKSLRQEMARLVQEEVQKSVLAQSKNFESIISSLSQASIIEDSVHCSLCKNELGPGEPVYHCMACPKLYLCEDCEENKGHQHALIKARRPGERFEYKMELVDETKILGKVKPGASITKLWTLRNSGKKKWPENIELLPVAGHDLKPKASAIGIVLPGEHCDIVMNLRAPTAAGSFKQVFKLAIHGKKFGPELTVEVNTEEEEKKKLDRENYEVDRMKQITKEIENMRKAWDFDRKYENNLIEIMKVGNWSVNDVLRRLMQFDNDPDKALAALFPESTQFGTFVQACALINSNTLLTL
eukprot:TRINITY_DN1361_c0_g1_i1.p3 TRINITY_DN1361_c0_g1~~TRINITY_DN1361_c0_g1_i1.p3  ORF type:complete len:450 (+),score=51.05 TRINITY_DN1361_c0_g1_i1:6871-8220(+)